LLSQGLYSLKFFISDNISTKTKKEMRKQQMKDVKAFLKKKSERQNKEFNFGDVSVPWNTRI